MTVPGTLDRQIDRLIPEVADLLRRLVEIPSVSGSEHDVQSFLKQWLDARLLQTALQHPDTGLDSDPDFRGAAGAGHTPNVVFTLPHSGGGRSLLLNSHTDTVPPAADQQTGDAGHSGRVFGRGAVDAKGQVAAIVLAMLALKETGIRLRGPCMGVAVTEEELGGTGTLSWIRSGGSADAAIVLEPTRMSIHPANRGALWFRIRTWGVSTHMGRYWEGESAFENLEKILAELRQFEADLVQLSRQVPLFPSDPSPVHANIGQVTSGDWPATVPAEAVAEGGFSFLPNVRLADVEDGIRCAVGRAAKAMGFRAEVTFDRLRNEAYGIDSEHPAVQALADAARDVHGEDDIRGYLASCDARLLYHRAGIPTIVFGPGDLLEAHARDESIDVDEVAEAARILARFVVEWCGQ